MILRIPIFINQSWEILLPEQIFGLSSNSMCYYLALAYISAWILLYWIYSA